MAVIRADSLRMRDEYSRLLFEEATDGVFVSSPDGVYLDVNRSGHRMLGFEPGELIGKRIADVILERDLLRLRVGLAAVSAGEVQTQIWPMVCKDGSIVHCEVSAQRLSNGAILALVRDLEGRAGFERRLQAGEAKLWSILRTAPDTILTVDRAGQILFINRARPPLTVEQVVGTSCYDYVPAESRARVSQAIEHVFTTRDFDSYEVQGPADPQGKRNWVAVRVGPLIECDRVVGATFCATDVSARKAEAARMQELAERLAKIASLVPGVLYQYQLRPDGTSCVPYASERLYDVFGLRPEAVRESAEPLLRMIHPEDRADFDASVARSGRTLDPWHHEFRAFAHGEMRWFSGTSVPAYEADGSTVWHGLISDVTERKHAEKARAKLEAQLTESQKMESVGQLAGGVAHDFNNLLTAVVASIELTQDELPADSKAHEYLDAVRDATTRGAALTQQLLAFARKKLVKPEEVNLNAILKRMAPTIQRLVGDRIALTQSLEPELSAVEVDVGSMEQVIVHLVVNARDAMPHGGRLALATHVVTLDEAEGGGQLDVPPGKYVELSVADTGNGITPEVRSHLFEPFFTTKAPGVGTGLGLPMCHGITKQAGGTISVQSEPGQGATFRIYLPARKLPQARATTVQPSRAKPGHETLLVVEDEPLILRVAQSALEKLGYRVLCANDGLQALEVANRTAEPIDLVITDVVMPKLGGPELASRLEELRPGTKVLYTSGYAESSLASQGVLRAGINLVQKPYALATLATRVREMLDGR